MNILQGFIVVNLKLMILERFFLTVSQQLNVYLFFSEKSYLSIKRKTFKAVYKKNFVDLITKIFLQDL